jgi:hypothetical protein
MVSELAHPANVSLSVTSLHPFSLLPDSWFSVSPG